MAESAIKRLSDRDDEHGEGTVAFTLTKPIDLGQMGVELAKAQGWDEPPGIMAEGPVGLASTNDPVVIWVMNPETDAAKVRSVVSKHKVPVNEYDKLVTKAQAGDDLTPEETQEALRLLLLRVR